MADSSTAGARGGSRNLETGSSAGDVSSDSASEAAPQAGQVAVLLESFGETKLRYFAVEYLGAFMHTLMTDLFRWTEHYQYSDAFRLMNPGIFPKVDVKCLQQTTPGTSTCEGPVVSPLAGATLPRNYMFTCLADGLSFICCSMSAPGATILPQFTVLYCMVGLKGLSTFLPSIIGQFLGILTARILTYFLLRTAIGFQTKFFLMTADQVQSLVEDLFALNYPGDDVTNHYAFLYAFLSGVMLVFLMTPMLHRCITLPAFARDGAKGIAMAVFQAGFGQNGLGNMPNPTQWIVTACFLQTLLGYNVWAKHNYYALIVPMWAPLLGVVFGAFLYRVYMALLHLGKVDVPSVHRWKSGDETRRRSPGAAS